MANRKIEAFQNVNEKPLEVIPPVPPVGAEPITEKPVFRGIIPDQQPAKLPVGDTSNLETPTRSTFKSNIPQRSLEDSPSKLRGEVIQQTTEVRNNVFRGSVPTSPLERGR